MIVSSIPLELTLFCVGNFPLALNVNIVQNCMVPRLYIIILRAIIQDVSNPSPSPSFLIYPKKIVDFVLFGKPQPSFSIFVQN